MTILVCTQYYWPETFPINGLIPLLSERGVRVTVLTGKPNYPEGKIFSGYCAAGIHREQHEGVEIFRVPTLPRGKQSKVSLALNYICFILACLFMGPRLLRRTQYDLVFVYAPSPLLQALPAIWLARRRNAPLVVWVQDLWPESLTATGHVTNRWLLALTERLVRMIYRASARILVQSRAFIPAVSALTDKAEKVHYYPNPYRPVASRKAEARAAGLAAELGSCFGIVFAGNLGTAQGLDTIADTARRLLPYPDIRIALVGSGSLDSWLMQVQESHRLNNLILAGRLDPAELPAIFEASQALLVTLKPEPAFSLTIPSKVQAYLAAGRPILASLDGEGARIIREAGAGLCSEAGNAEALAANALQLRKMTPQERKQLGTNGRRYFDAHFAPDLLADELSEHFRELINPSMKRK